MSRKTTGNYAIVRPLGEGGFGETFLVEHRLLGKPAVLKRARYSGKGEEKLLLDEASLLWDIHHWGLPTLKDVFIEDGSLNVVMTYIPGKTLDAHVRESGFVGLEDACWIAGRVLSSLSYLHYRGIVHRDIKPTNLIVDFDTHMATLVDFGLSRKEPRGDPERSGYTPVFAPPEQIEGRPPLPESDFFALGVTVIWMLGGEARARKLPKGVPPRLRDFVEALVRPEPLERPRYAEALQSELRAIRGELFGREHTR